MSRDLSKSEFTYLQRALRDRRPTAVIARRLKVSERTVHRLIARYFPRSFSPLAGVHNLWSVRETDYLLAHYASADWEEMLDALPGRSRAVIAEKARRLGLRRSHRAQRRRDTRPCNLHVRETRPRACLCCKKGFESEGPHHRLCTECRTSVASRQSEYSFGWR